MKRSLWVAGCVVILLCLARGAIADQEPTQISLGAPPGLRNSGAPESAGTTGAAESYNAFFQATYVWQRHGSIRAPYSGATSLSANREKAYTVTATGYFGLRAWPGGEIYFNPEVVQGVALSHLTGLGGLSNGENQKGSNTSPVLYRARLFMRQTWGFGGGEERAESSANQLAGAVDRKRLVLTAGNFALIDIFDANANSHDPRTQLMNWALMTHGAYDYAADARGYTWGAALEYVDADWTLRVARTLEPFESNGMQLDYRIAGHHGDQVELQHAHTIGGMAGSLRLLAFRNFARMGNFRDALAFAAAGGGAPSVADVRRDQAKHGFGVNLDQQLGRGLGMFARASWNDGGTETYSFTEIERSASGGISVKGAAWGRPDDTIFFGAVRNGLSAAHRDYLAAGGVGFFIGDGRLNYRPESILELTYSARIAKGAWLGIDVQRIANPAYNADRGPVTIAGMRLHLEF